jgi:hypothetical protein
VNLSSAWIHYGSERQRRQQVERRGTPSSLVIQELMMGDIFGMLASNQLRAMGYRTAPELSDGPIPIPNDVFEFDQKPHWQSDTASASGYAYERVRVLPADSPEREIANAATPEAQAAIEAAVAPSDRSMYGLCARVFDALKADNESSVWLSAELLEESFREKYIEVHGKVAKLKPPPQLRTLRTHLKRYREDLQQVSANIGKLPNNT